MSRINAKKETFEEVEILKTRMLFSHKLIDPKTVPKGMYMYEVRQKDVGDGTPVQIGKWIIVNHSGTLISNRPIKLGPTAPNGNAYLDIDPDKDWNYLGTESTLADYMKKYPPIKESQEAER